MRSKRIAQGRLLSLPEIAAWQIANAPAKPYKKCIADLPAIQRGSVWKVKQIEDLWDSIVQGFPIGAFLLSPIVDKTDLEIRGRQNGKFQQDGRLHATHHLLDGQQRSTAIALGFLDPSVTNFECKGLIWVDIVAPPAGRDVAYVFRVLTRAHPWGYKRVNPSDTLSLKQIRESLEAYKKACPEHKELRPDQIPLSDTWPRDAGAPIPLACLISELMAPGTLTEKKGRILEKVKRTAFWNETKQDWHNEQKANVASVLTEKGNVRIDHLLSQLEVVLSGNNGYGVPILILPHIAGPVSDTAHPDYNQNADTTDPFETLFIRINSGGTPLEGEELIYSLIKSHWVEAPDFIEGMSNRLAVPSRIALMCARLVLARGDQAKMVRAPGVSEFRRLIRSLNKDHVTFADDLKSLVTGRGQEVFSIAYNLLTEGNFGLPPVLATSIAQSSPDVFFILLRWIDLMLEEGKHPLQMTENKRRKLIGFITALSWFAKDKGKACSAIWTDLHTIQNKELFFNRDRLVKALKLDKSGSLCMIPLPSPTVLEESIKQVIRGRANYPGIEDAKSRIWQSWNRWDWFINAAPKNIITWYKQYFSKKWSSGRADWEGGLPTIYREAWGSFLTALWGNRSILLYAQRHWIVEWFRDFDPSQPENLEDKNRPWDFDHIHPQSFLRNDSGNSRRNIPSIIWDWHGSIGNLRAWPLELNRADGDTSPECKLNRRRTAISDEEKRYFLHSSKDMKSASFIGRSDWPDWKLSTPAQCNNPRYLSDTNNHEYRKHLIIGISKRFASIYRDWYESLCIKDLMPR